MKSRIWNVTRLSMPSDPARWLRRRRDCTLTSRCWIDWRQKVESTHVTLHVGAGTFQPVRAERLEDHLMHSEFLEVSEDTCDSVQCPRPGGRVVAVGTTSVRSLESAAVAGSCSHSVGIHGCLSGPATGSDAWMP